MDTTIQFRTTKKEKEKARKILAGIGLDLSTALTMFLHQINRQKALPIKGLTENGFTPEFEEEVLADLKHMREHPEQYKAYGSAEELHADILGAKKHA